ncbi:hypothetical protein EJD97_024268 [Solanum chilense]|uniref:Uncharacterized protein n=1 Tax=Solanum chilense TaxID=4083 RepID=A0A6N2ASZ8_SOLCI|nr:hypothetical protein EJD97_024268 [Solanum chilense]
MGKTRSGFCHLYPCGWIEGYHDYYEKDNDSQFVKKLRPEFEHLHASILNKEKLPALEVVVYLSSSKETRLSSQASMENSLTMDTAFVAYRSSSSFNSNKLVQ